LTKSRSAAANEKMGGFMERLMHPAVLRAVQQLKPIADEAGLTLPQFALAWVLREPNVASAIIGASRPSQVSENAAASGVVVDTQLFMRAEQIVDEALSRTEMA
jgi:aryl-alcohol dehydrogenase-like predicted oxidoreductase